ncbi:hypothetical protein A3K29_04345 [Candidatus Collierbacteria bacterium RIFOXYB2_FULL_46_14]|uniref:Uncharacterized protein n=1 Tax=Candidatus Collierbacteria bacterium GW2011_GWA2_46_26 TaxID=1618381 RepID=A0A0G1SJK6_9BACT|nr:MAG: hypothetical protein UW29_C0002G0048 [Candidatus Collierbacteria bacterium GW2011_GWC2_44_13]KKU33525.1 MAG: hypothetical protein UX47_C0003G0048 [Candidatus Collierbacteria bacterium GW2011_GWA2_46_26]OGD73331.1 MAG: hypothetical protein A3K29_04345 [Candidatus Collierbacteria bacterium RIFOXYB2_FULL_46_14]OGD76373.1 MAG: hypothetical protein A3K43_04345 [Candidatus Collierbacteria bacterium RIFOXYA2_FULL_46_20]OGD77709.1 MAG: hypothetical protein A3K39_04345 [Candidatus Collierbacteri
MNREFLPFRIEADDSLSDNWFTQSPERLDKLRSDVTGKPKSVITLWAEEFKITPMEANLALEKGTGIFVTMETNSLDPATSVQFWLENALAKRNDLSANIWNGNRTKKYEVSAKKAREYSQLQDLSLASPEQELSALMVTLAKLEAIMPIMTKVYPGLQWNAVKESQLAMKQLLDKIGDDSKSSSKQNLALVATSGIVVITLILVACATASRIKSASTSSTTKTRAIETTTSTAISAEASTSTPNEFVPAIDDDGYFAPWVDQMFCKDPAYPYLEIHYTGTTNPTTTCEKVKVKPPVQVTDEQLCPPNTIRTPIYPDEGSEAVCIPN